MISDRHCFEMYGYDIMVDQNLKPWLLEANASPSLSCTTPEDKALKMAVIHDTLAVVSPPNWAAVETRKNRVYPDRVGVLELLYDEASEMAALDARPPPRATGARPASARRLSLHVDDR